MAFASRTRGGLAPMLVCGQGFERGVQHRSAHTAAQGVAHPGYVRCPEVADPPVAGESFIKHALDKGPPEEPCHPSMEDGAPPDSSPLSLPQNLRKPVLKNISRKACFWQRAPPQSPRRLCYLPGKGSQVSQSPKSRLAVLQTAGLET